MGKRFVWTAERRRLLRDRWLSADTPAQLAAAIGCKVRSAYAEAERLGLGPRDPVLRAIRRGAPAGAAGAISLAPVALRPTCFDEQHMQTMPAPTVDVSAARHGRGPLGRAPVSFAQRGQR